MINTRIFVIMVSVIELLIPSVYTQSVQLSEL